MIILIVILAIIAIPLILALFTKKAYTVERDIIIFRPRQDVFNYIKLLRNQEQYSKWVMQDPNAIKIYTGTDGTTGFSMAWDSQDKNVGKGIQTISNVRNGEGLDLDVHFIKPFEGDAKAYITTSDIGSGQTKVKWGLSSSMKYPMNIMLLLLNMERMLGNDISTGLTNLKNKLEG